MKIGIVLLATNAYFVLGLRFIKRWNTFYKGNAQIQFHFFSEKNPHEYLPNTETNNVFFHEERHTSWLEGTNSKFKNILKLKNEDLDYIYYVDADTTIDKEFTEDWMLGEIVGAEHFGNNSWMKNEKPYERFEKSKAYVPKNTNLPQTYFHGAFLGGKKEKFLQVCQTLLEYQLEDKKINFEPGVNDESYINAYFHYNPPHVIKLENFMFTPSDKGGIDNSRNTNLNISHLLEAIKANINANWNIKDNQIVFL